MTAFGIPCVEKKLLRGSVVTEPKGTAWPKLLPLCVLLLLEAMERHVSAPSGEVRYNTD